MHRLRSFRSCLIFRRAAFWFICRWLLLGLAIIFFAIALWRYEWNMALAGVGSLFSSLFCGLMRIIHGHGARCPLCLVPVLSGSDCAKHRQARTLLGSHRFRVALSILIRGWFRCPYCDEPTSVKFQPWQKP